jgi:hypothetical protein
MALFQETDFVDEFWCFAFVSKHPKKSLYEAVETIIVKVPPPAPSREGSRIKGRGNAYVQYFLDIVLERDIQSGRNIVSWISGIKMRRNSVFHLRSTDAVRLWFINRKDWNFQSSFFLLPKNYTRKPKDKLWLNAEEQDFGFTKVLIDNSTAVEGFEKKLLLFSIKKNKKNCWIISMCCMWH